VPRNYKNKWSKEIVLPASEIYQLPDVAKASVQSLQDAVLSTNDISADVLRLDRIHPVISGNKWFKLTHYLQQAIRENKQGVITFGGAWSNHLLATALACKLYNLPAIGIVRGTPGELYAPLQEAASYDMQLHFADRIAYAHPEKLIKELQLQYPDHFIIPQGGQGENGVKGAAEMISFIPYQQYTHLACAVGTGTMMAGLVRAALPHQQVTGISSLKITTTNDNSLHRFVEQYSHTTNFTLLYNYHFGGYARHTPVLIDFMNAFYRQHEIDTDFVYTGKLMYGIVDLVKSGYFAPGSRLLIIHSGGLQGNRSLPAGSLQF
jgi:1-aminocyclopropane-1-carboxylate deaminase